MKAGFKNYLLLLVLMFCLEIPCQAARIHAGDTAEVSLKLPSGESIKSFKNNPDYHYRKDVTVPSLWDRIRQWFRDHWNIRQNSFADKFLTTYFWYALFIGLLIFVIYQVFKSEITGLFSRSSRQTIKMEALEEDIHTLDFENQIQDAIRQKNFRYAIRLYYLKALKELSDKELIEWKPDKTGRDYQYELSGKSIQEPFASITYLFHWVWYGELPLSEDNFNLAREEFLAFNTQLAQ